MDFKSYIIIVSNLVLTFIIISKDKKRVASVK